MRNCLPQFSCIWKKSSKKTLKYSFDLPKHLRILTHFPRKDQNLSLTFQIIIINTGKDNGKFAYPECSMDSSKHSCFKILDFPAFLHNVELYKYFFVSLFIPR